MSCHTRLTDGNNGGLKDVMPRMLAMLRAAPNMFLFCLPSCKKNQILPLPASCVFAPGEQESRAQGLPASGGRGGGEREPSQ